MNLMAMFGDLKSNETAEMINGLYRFESRLAKMVTASKASDSSKYVTLMELDEQTMASNISLPWKKILTNLFNGTVEIREKESIYITNPKYYAALEKLLASTSKK